MSAQETGVGATSLGLYSVQGDATLLRVVEASSPAGRVLRRKTRPTPRRPVDTRAQPFVFAVHEARFLHHVWLAVKVKHNAVHVLTSGLGSCRCLPPNISCAASFSPCHRATVADMPSESTAAAWTTLPKSSSSCLPPVIAHPASFSAARFRLRRAVPPLHVVQRASSSHSFLSASSVIRPKRRTSYTIDTRRTDVMITSLTARRVMIACIEWVIPSRRASGRLAGLSTPGSTQSTAARD